MTVGVRTAVTRSLVRSTGSRPLGKLPRVAEWSSSGSADDGVGVIEYRRIPLGWWLLDPWLLFGHPHWEWWYRAWSRVLPYWGDPFCAAYATIWGRIYSAHEEDRTSVEVGWDKLPPSERRRLEAQDRSHGRAASAPDERAES